MTQYLTLLYKAYCAMVLRSWLCTSSCSANKYSHQHSLRLNPNVFWYTVALALFGVHQCSELSRLCTQIATVQVAITDTLTHQSPTAIVGHPLRPDRAHSVFYHLRTFSYANAKLFSVCLSMYSWHHGECHTFNLPPTPFGELAAARCVGLVPSSQRLYVIHLMPMLPSVLI
jgi:hypothetical protein